MTSSTPVSFAVTYDYRCPFARIAHDHILTGLRNGAPWDVTFLPFALGQTHVADGEPSVWERPESDSGLLALQVSVAVRDRQPDVFLDVHGALFELRHADGGDLRDPDAITPVLKAAGADSDAVWAEVESRRPLATVEKEHRGYVESHHVFGVPTFIVGDSAVFVRLLDRAAGDEALALSTIERLLDQIAWSSLNELKHTAIPR